MQVVFEHEVHQEKDAAWRGDGREDSGPYRSRGREGDEGAGREARPIDILCNGEGKVEAREWTWRVSYALRHFDAEIEDPLELQHVGTEPSSPPRGLPLCACACVTEARARAALRAA